MLIIGLQRVGRKNDPAFRLIVTDSRKGPKTGRYLELLGSYNPKTKATILKKERILAWHRDGAQISDTVHNLLISNGILEGKKINVLPRKSPPKSSEDGLVSGGKEEEAPKAETVTTAPVEEVSAVGPETIPETALEAASEKAGA